MQTAIENSSDATKDAISEIVDIRRHGIKPNGQDMTATLNAALADIGPNATFIFPDSGDSTFTFEGDVIITNPGVYFKGASSRGTQIRYEPSAVGSCFHWLLSQNPGGIKDMHFQSTDNTYVKTAIKFTDGSDFHLDGIHIGISGADSWGDVSNSSVGIQGFGREIVSINKPRIFADKPIVLGINPNDTTLDVDQFNISNTYLVVSNNVGNAQIEILDSVNMFNFNVGGYNAWAKGRYGIYWHNTTNDSAVVSHGVNLSNIRCEQGYEGDGDAYLIYIDHENFNVQQMSIDHVYGDTGRKRGFYIKGARELRMSEIELTNNVGGNVPLEIVNNSSGGGMKYLSWDNCVFGEHGGASVIPDTLTLLESVPAHDTDYTLPLSAKYRFKEAATNQEKGVGVGEDSSGNALTKNYFAYSLLAPQDETGDLTISASGKTITSGGAMSFTGMLKGDRVNLDTASNANVMLSLASDATATVITVNEDTLSDESGVNGTVIHGVGLNHRSNITYLQKTDVTVYLSAEDAVNRTQSIECSESKTGNNATNTTTASGSTATVIAANDNPLATAPASDVVSFTAISAPAIIWNNRTSFSSVARIIVEQLNF